MASIQKNKKFAENGRSSAPAKKPRYMSAIFVAVAGACIWNDLPSDITSSPSLFTVKRRLKMHLFRFSYPSLTL